MASGTWDPTSLPIRPGLYINFRDAALAAIAGGARGTVAIPIYTYSGTAVAGSFYTVENVADAENLLGAVNSGAVKFALQGGAKEALVYAVPALEGEETPIAQNTKVLEAFEAREFNVFVYPTTTLPALQTDVKAWVARNREEGKHFIYVAGGTALEDADPTTGNARSVLLKDEYIVNLINGVILADGTEVASADYAPYIAGLIAGTPINESITYKDLPVAGVTKLLKNSEVRTALISGSLVLIKTANKVKIEQGITTDSDSTARGKIRSTRARQAIATDIPVTAQDNYIGKINNNAAGQAALISAIRRYFDTLEVENVLVNHSVTLDAQRPSVGDTVFLAISYQEVDSMERIFLTITV